jgi:N-acetylglucosaminyldiphosphoundecaprenol N-acetyl-beta-D-mannosaminyltransferase
LHGPAPQTTCLGVRLDAITMRGAVDRCVEWCRDPAATRIVFPVNASIVVAMQTDPALRAACDAADMRLADGASLLWATRLEGGRLPERVAGIDLMQRLIERAAADRLSLFFLGARPVVVKRLVEQCRSLYPDVRIAGFRDGYFDRAEENSLVQSIRAGGADILFIGMPTPFKEIWANTFRDQLGVRLILGVGGSFDVVAGFIPRSPLWLQRAGMEWLWRLLREPRRLWRRYMFTNTSFIVLVLTSAIKRTFRLRA